MKLESDGLLIDMRPLNERDVVGRIFTAEHGIIVGVLRAALIMKKNRPLVGQVGAAAWNARLDSQLGTFHWDATRNLAAPIMMDAKKLQMMNAAFGLLGTFLPERERYDNLYWETVAMLTALGGVGDHTAARDIYLGWEIALLRDLGYALNLNACSGCGTGDDLRYLSPRTGRAVCGTCGAPYADRLYQLPLGIDVTGKFLDLVAVNLGADVPVARRMLNP